MINTFINNLTQIIVGLIGIAFAVKTAELAIKERTTAAYGFGALAILSAMFAFGGASWFRALYCMGAGLFGLGC